MSWVESLLDLSACNPLASTDGLTLDVGCGRRRLGTVNVDLDSKVKPDVACDIHHLPFRDRLFEYVYCYHVLEHRGVHPRRAVTELFRVSKGYIECQVPHWLGPSRKAVWKDGTKEHVNFYVMRKRFWQRYSLFQLWTEFVFLKWFPFWSRPLYLTVIARRK